MKSNLSLCRIQWNLKLQKTTECEGKLIRKRSLFGTSVLGCKNHWKQFDEKLWKPES